MKIIVTGGRGFIGSHVVEALLKHGHEVKTIDLVGEPDYVGDIRNVDDMEGVFCVECPGIVFHTAAIADARAALNSPINAIEVNIGGTVSILEAARRARVDRVVLSSTCWAANAMGDGILDESSMLNPAGGGHIYTTTKLAGEWLAHDYKALYGQKFTILRYGIPYGPRMWQGLVLRNWCDRAAAGEPLTIFGDGSAARRFVYVEDLAMAHVLAVQEIAENQTYNLEGMRMVTIKELAEAFQRVWPDKVEIEYKEEPTRVGELKYQRKILSNHKAYTELGWEPRVDLETGLRRVVDWYRTVCLKEPELVG